MAARRRARADETARRVNAAAEELAAGTPVPDAARRLASRFAVSERQARRYLAGAQAAGPVRVPARKVVFTVTIEEPVRRRVGTYAATVRRTMGDVVAQALVEYMDRNPAGPGGGTADRR